MEHMKNRDLMVGGGDGVCVVVVLEGAWLFIVL